MPRRLLLLATAVLGGCAFSSFYAVFPAAVPGAEAQRATKGAFSLVGPAGWDRLDAAADPDLLWRETPPRNGQYLLYRFCTVEPAPAMAEDEPATMLANAVQLLRERHAKQDLEVRQTGSVQLGDRTATFLVGRHRGTAAGWFHEVLEYHVPGAEHSLVLAFSVPDGQFEASRPGFEQIAATLRTTLGLPQPGAAGRWLWLDDHHIGVRLPGDWEAQEDRQGALGVYIHAAGSARCDVTAETLTNGVDLGSLQANYEADQSARLTDLVLTGVQQRRVGDLPAVRFQSAYRDAGDTIVCDDLFVAKGKRIHRVLFRVPEPEFAALRGTIAQILDSVRVE